MASSRAPPEPEIVDISSEEDVEKLEPSERDLEKKRDLKKRDLDKHDLDLEKRDSDLEKRDLHLDPSHIHYVPRAVPSAEKRARLIERQVEYKATKQRVHDAVEKVFGKRSSIFQ